jgi:transposase
MGTIGRSSGEVRLEVLIHTSKAEVQGYLNTHRNAHGVCYTDEHLAYKGVENQELAHKTVCHSIKEWARDDDGDGINEVHSNTIEGFWQGLRNFLRPFRGVSKHHLDIYVATYEWIHNNKDINSTFIRALVFSPNTT